MTSPETPPQAPQRSAVVGDGSWKAVMPIAIVLGAFLTFLGAMITYFDNRFTVGIAGFRTELAMTEQRLTSQIAEVKTDLTNRIDGVEKRLTDRIDQVETGLNARIDRVEKRLTDRIDRVEKELGNRIDRVESGLGTRIDEVKTDLEASEARQSAATKRLTAGIAENRAAHRELAGFVHARHLGAPQPATEQPEPPPAQ